MTLTMSPKGYAVVRSFEGRSLKAYRDEVGVWTIGYGNTNFDAEVLGFTIQAGVTITNEQCEQLLVAAMTRRYEPAVNAKMGPDVTQPAFDAGDGFHYNTGAIGRASWVQSYVAKNLPAVHSQIMQWNKAGGNVLAGLTRRRNREWEMISTGDYGPEGANAALDMTTGKPVGSSPASTTPQEASKPESPSATPDVASSLLKPWHARMEAILGMYRFASGDNPAIIEMAKQCGGKIAESYKHQDTAWCALTVNYCLVTTGFKGDDSLWALDFRSVGSKLSGPCVGAIATKTRNGGGHVFLVRGKTASGQLVGTGGNQSSMVCDEAFDPSVLEFNWPDGAPLPAKVGMGTLPVVEVRAHVHKDYGTDYIDHPAMQIHNVPGHLDGTPGMLKKGDKGPEVADFQKQLVAAGYSVGPDGPDGDFGDMTDVAVRHFQHSHPQLPETGIGDPATRVALKRDADAKAKLKTAAGRGAGTTVITKGVDAASGGHVHWGIYVAIGVVVLGALCYTAWTYRDEIRAMLSRSFGGGKS